MHASVTSPHGRRCIPWCSVGNAAALHRGTAYVLPTATQTGCCVKRLLQNEASRRRCSGSVSDLLWNLRVCALQYVVQYWCPRSHRQQSLCLLGHQRLCDGGFKCDILLHTLAVLHPGVAVHHWFWRYFSRNQCGDSLYTVLDPQRNYIRRPVDLEHNFTPEQQRRCNEPLPQRHCACLTVCVQASWWTGTRSGDVAQIHGAPLRPAELHAPLGVARPACAATAARWAYQGASAARPTAQYLLFQESRQRAGAAGLCAPSPTDHFCARS